MYIYYNIYIIYNIYICNNITICMCIYPLIDEWEKNPHKNQTFDF